MLLLSFFLALLAFALFLLANKQRRQAGIPTGRVVYIDTSAWGKVEKPLFDPQLRLTGKPDYLVKQGDMVIPVEVKSRRAPQSPHDSHVFQLGAYCLLVTHEYHKRPSFGVVHYADKSFAIDFTAELEKSVKATIREMQAMANNVNLDRSHQDGKRCLHCGYQSKCDQALRI